MGRISNILTAAHTRIDASAQPYSGALLPHEALELLELAPGTSLIDVRSRAELDLNGSIPGAIHVEWRSWPGWVQNPHFIMQLRQLVDAEATLLFICRNGQRSHQAAVASVEAGFGNCYNVLEGFEGEIDKNTGHRNEINGWKFRGLPWTQG
jgi:Rhodanese-related sulfurtransferase